MPGPCSTTILTIRTCSCVRIRILLSSASKQQRAARFAGSAPHVHRRECYGSCSSVTRSSHGVVPRRYWTAPRERHPRDDAAAVLSASSPCSQPRRPRRLLLPPSTEPPTRAALDALRFVHRPQPTLQRHQTPTGGRSTQSPSVRPALAASQAHKLLRCERPIFSIVKTTSACPAKSEHESEDQARCMVAPYLQYNRSDYSLPVRAQSRRADLAGCAAGI